MKRYLFALLILISACSKEEEISLINGLWTAEEETMFYFYEYSFELHQVGDSIAVLDLEVIATFREPTLISWTPVNGRINGDQIYLKFKDGSGFVVFDGILSDNKITTSKYYGYYYGGEYEEELRSEVIFSKN